MDDMAGKIGKAESRQPGKVNARREPPQNLSHGRDPYRPPVLEVFDRVRAMSFAERWEIMVRAGIVDENGDLTPRYGGKPKPKRAA
jgi:hypothetical protein